MMPQFDEYLPVQTLDIESESKITFDLYVNLPLNQKYVLYRRKGGQVENSRIETLDQSRHRKFYVHKSEYQEFVKYVAVRLKNLVDTGNVENNKKMMTAAARSILSSTFDENNPVITDVFMSNLNEITRSIIESVLEASGGYQKKTFQRFAELAQTGTHFQKHPVNVASLAILIAFGIGYSNQKILSDLAMAALLHDIGLSKLPPQLIIKSHTPKLLTASDREKLFDHPQVSLDILQERNVDVSPLTKTIILQHHEEFNGFGYPKGIRGYAINEFAQIMRVADELDQLISNGYSTHGSLKLAVSALFDEMVREMVIESTLCLRIKSLLI